MKKSWKAVLVTAALGAGVLLILFIAMSCLMNWSLDDYANGPHEYISDDVGFFWLLLFVGLTLAVIMATGPIAAWLARGDAGSKKEALVVPAIACALELLLAATIIELYGRAVMAAHILPYFSDMYPNHIVPITLLCTPLYLSCAIMSAIIGYRIALRVDIRKDARSG
jgi:hypothetical protein